MSSLETNYLILALLIWFAGYFHNGKLVRPKWKVPGKLLFYVGVAFVLTHWWQHYALLFIIGHPLIGLVFHTKICSAHGINWFSCQPHEKYLEVQQKWAKGDFSGKPKD